MAKIYHHTSKLRHCCRRQRFYFVLCMLGIAAALALTYLIVVPGRLANAWWLLGTVAMIAGCILLAAQFNKRHRILLSGVQGEKQTEEILSHLPDTYRVLVNPILVCGGEHRELDFIVIGPTGVHVVEVKNHKGRLEGSPVATTWLQYKRDGRYFREMANPLRQVSRQLQEIERLLTAHRLSVPLYGVLYFANKDADVRVSLHERSPITILSAADGGAEKLLSLIDGKRSSLDAHAVIKVMHWLNRRP